LNDDLLELACEEENSLEEWDDLHKDMILYTQNNNFSTFAKKQNNMNQGNNEF